MTLLDTVRRVAPQHRDRIMTTDYCDAISPHVFINVSIYTSLARGPAIIANSLPDCRPLIHRQ